MSATTAIEWTDSTWSPVTGCSKVSAGCDHCYADTIAHRFAGTKAWPNGFDVTLWPDRLDIPLRWRKPRRIFVCSTADLFHDQVPDEYIARVWQAMGCAPKHTYQILTKRHARMRSWVTRWYAGEVAEPYEVREAPGYPGYRVSTLGEVFGKRSDTAGGLSYDVGEQGHRRVTMHREGSPRSGDRELVHRLVLTAFVRPAVAGEQACHRNGDPSDNRLSNLYWGSQSDNWHDRIRHGNGRSWSKLTEADVAIIRTRADAGDSAYRIAQDFPVSDTQIRNVLRGDQWATPTDMQRPQPPARAVLDCVWLGVSTENQQWANIRIPALLDTPAAVRFISAEPLLGPIRFEFEHFYEPTHSNCSGLMSPAHEPACGREPGPHWGIDWVVTGGESGPGARAAHPDWFRSIRDQCQAAGVAYLHKQNGEWVPAPWYGPDGATHAFTGGLYQDQAGAWVENFMALGHNPMSGERDRTTPPGAQGMRRVGKKSAGRELDGRTWDDYPQQVTADG